MGPGPWLGWERCHLAVQGLPSSVLPSPLPQDPLPLLLALRLWLQLAGWAPFLCRERLGGGGGAVTVRPGGVPLSPSVRRKRAWPLKSQLPPCPTLEVFTGNTTQGPLSWRVTQSGQQDSGVIVANGPNLAPSHGPRRGGVVQWLERSSGVTLGSHRPPP